MSKGKKNSKSRLGVVTFFWFFTLTIIGLMIGIFLKTPYETLNNACTYSIKPEISKIESSLKQMDGVLNNTQGKSGDDISEQLKGKIDEIKTQIGMLKKYERACSKDYYRLPSIPYSVVIIFIALLIGVIVAEKNPATTEITETTETTQTTKTDEITENVKTPDSNKTTKTPGDTKTTTTKITKTSKTHEMIEPPAPIVQS